MLFLYKIPNTAALKRLIFLTSNVMWCGPPCILYGTCCTFKNLLFFSNWRYKWFTEQTYWKTLFNMFSINIWSEHNNKYLFIVTMNHFSFIKQASSKLDDFRSLVWPAKLEMKSYGFSNTKKTKFFLIFNSTYNFINGPMSFHYKNYEPN